MNAERVRTIAAIGVILTFGTAAAQTPSENHNSEEQAATVSVTQTAATSAQNQELSSNDARASSEKSSANQSASSLIQNRKDKISYAFGVNLARDFSRQENDLNVDLLMKALSDALAKKPLIMTDEEVTATLKKFEDEQKQDYEHARMMISQKNKRTGEAFFSENAKKEGVVTLPSGLQYKILKKGDGKTPGIDDKVVCQYRGTLLDGTEFDGSEKRGHAVRLPVKGLIAGWTQALQMMPVGSKWQLFIPSQLAYGEKIVNGIGPNAMLIFEVELLSIEDKAQTARAAR